MVGVRLGRLALGIALTLSFSYAQDGTLGSNHAQNDKPPSFWARTFGTRDTGFDDPNAVYERVHCIESTTDGGSIFVAFTTYHGAGAWVVKFKADDTIEWQNHYSTTGTKMDLKAIRQTNDGGYVVLANVNQVHGRDADPWVMKLNSRGEFEWEWSYSSLSGGMSSATDICQVKDGSYVLVGWVAAPRKIKTGDIKTFPVKAFVVKLNADGTRAWDKTSSDGSLAQTASAVAGTPDGGFVVTGSELRLKKETFGGWVIKFDAEGKVEWDEFCGGGPSAIRLTSDGGYILAGSIGSRKGIWLRKLSASGSTVWMNSVNVPNIEPPPAVRQTLDGGFVVATGMSYGDGQVVADASILKFASDGTIEWQKQYGAGQLFGISGIIQTGDRGYMVAGSTSAYGVGSFDVWVLKLRPDGSLPSTLWPNPDTNFTASPASFTSGSSMHIVGTRESTFVATKGISVAIPTDAIIKQQAP